MGKNYTEYKQLDLVRLAGDILDFWERENIFQRSVEEKDPEKTFVFFEGPPSANGLPGIHHVIGRTVKDIFARYKSMQGYRVERKAGWDTHGLPVELGVEKKLGITKEDIGTRISVDEYNRACKESVLQYTGIWNDLTRRIGYWVDMEHPYITYKSKYMETVWWLLKQLYDKGLLYKGYTIQPYSPKAGTGLSSHELNQPGCYRNVTDTTIVAQFKIKDTDVSQLPFPSVAPEEEYYFLAWTTTPWTLPSNTALAVGNKIDYVLVKTYNQYTYRPVHVILAKDRLQAIFGKKFYPVSTAEEWAQYEAGDKKIPYMIEGEVKGKELLEIRYEQLMPYALPYQNPENAFRVIAGDFVTTEDGTGIVHIAPTFGQDDANVAKKANPEIPPMLVLNDEGDPVPLVDLQGRFTKHMKEYAGKYVKSEYYTPGEEPERPVDVEIAIQLKTENKAFHVEKHSHNYPHCWRTDKPVLYYPLDSWFVRVTEMRDRLYELNKQINWVPASTGEGRFGNWLKNANDWNLSRSRFWGIPLPIWRSEDGKEEKIIGSVSELMDEIDRSIKAGFMQEHPYPEFVSGDMSDENYEKIDIHKNYVDKIVLVSDSGQPMYREPDLIDVWFDSGSMPVAQWHYPFENKEKVEEKGERIADFIAEGVDQTRGWFYTLHAISGMVFDSIAYKNVLSNGLVLDKFGKKMSKRLGNAIDPFKTLDDFGPDPIRWYMITNTNPWDNLKFDIDGVDEVRRKFFGTLYNTYAFFALYANLDGFRYAEAEVPLKDRPELDRWILSELHSLIRRVSEAYDRYDATFAARNIQHFVTEHLSNWFVRLSRRRFWKGEYGPDKISAYQTLHTCMLEVARLAAPVAPFFMERLYKDLTRGLPHAKDSVHLADFPVSDASFIDTDLEEKMQKAQLISSIALSLRQKEKIKVRQPLQRIMVPVLNEKDKQMLEAVSGLIKAEINVKEIELLTDTSGILVKEIKPDYKRLGPRFGAKMKGIAARVAQMTQEEIQEFEQKGEFTFDIDNESITLTLDEVEIRTKDIDGWLVATQQHTTVALDIQITDELRKEGIARELINRIQNYRKKSGFEVTDRIRIHFSLHPVLEEAVKVHEDYIKNETLADAVFFDDDTRGGVDLSFDGIEARMRIEK